MRSTTKSDPTRSKAVLERLASCGPLLATLEDLARDDSAAGPGVPASGDLLQGVFSWLRYSATELIRCDDRVFALQARLAHTRRQRNARVKALARDLGQLRVSIESQYRDPQIERLGFETPTPRSPQPLLRVATRVAENLAHPDLADLLGNPWYARPFDPATHRDELATRAEELHHLLHQVDTLIRDLDQARIRRHRALDGYDTLTRETNQIIESVRALRRLAGWGSPFAPSSFEPLRHLGQTTERLGKPADGSRGIAPVLDLGALRGERGGDGGLSRQRFEPRPITGRVRFGRGAHHRQDHGLGLASRPTGAYHPVPFEKLSPTDFERMCLWLVRRENF